MNMAVDMALDEVSGGWLIMSGLFDKTAKQAEHLTEQTGQEPASLGL